MRSKQSIRHELGNACGGSWDDIYDIAIVATQVLKNIKQENQLLKMALCELGGPKYYEEWCRIALHKTKDHEHPDRVGKCHLAAPLEICSTLKCEDCMFFYK